VEQMSLARKGYEKGKSVLSYVTYPVTAAGGYLKSAGMNVVGIAAAEEKYEVPEGSNLIHEPILPMEKAMFVDKNEPPVSSVTFFAGDATTAAVTLKQRCKLVFEANPWMAGRVGIPNKDTPMSLIYPPSSDITLEMMDEYVLLNPEGVTMNEGMTYEELMAQTLSGGVGVSYGGTIGVPMFRITLVDCGAIRKMARSSFA